MSFKKIIVATVVLLAACSSTFENVLFSLVPHPKEPKERHYEIKQVSFTNSRDSITIAGELTFPSTGKNFPAVILVSGHEGEAPRLIEMTKLLAISIFQSRKLRRLFDCFKVLCQYRRFFFSNYVY